MTPTRSKRARSRSEEIEAKKIKAGPAVGDACPDFELETDDSNPEELHKISLKEMVKDNGVVIFFYPRANTPGCTTQACGFQENYSAIEKEGYKVYGMSADKPRSQASWKKKHHLQYTLLCDPTYEVLGLLGVLKQGKKIARSHIVIEKGGQIKSIQIGIGPKISVTGALKTIQEMNSSSPTPAEAPPGDEQEDAKDADQEGKHASEDQAMDPVDDDIPPAVKEPEKVVDDSTAIDASHKDSHGEDAGAANGTPTGVSQKESHKEETGATNGTPVDASHEEGEGTGATNGDA